MIDTAKFSLEDLQALNNLVQAKYVRSVSALSGGKPTRKQTRWHRFAVMTQMAVIRKKNGLTP